MLKINQNYLIQGLITAILIMGGLLLMKTQLPPKVVKIDLVGITSHYTEMIVQSSLGGSKPDNPAIKKISETIKLNLEPILNTYAEKHHVIIIQSQAMVAGNVPDISKQIISELDKKIKDDQ